MKTAKAKREKVQQAQTEILEVTRITEEQYNEIMFQQGVLFAEHFCRNFLNVEDMTRSLLQDKNLMYWDWFKMVYRHDDVLMVENDCLNRRSLGAEKYLEMKECIIGDELLENDLYHFISDHL